MHIRIVLHRKQIPVNYDGFGFHTFIVFFFFFFFFLSSS
jgi:hypothetical protein